MDKEIMAKILHDAYNEGCTISSWEVRSSKEKGRWLRAVDSLEDYSESQHSSLSDVE